MTDVASTLHARGMRLTAQRRRIIEALSRLEHAAPDAVAAEVAADGGTPLPLSTVYRALHALSDLGLVAHTHLDHGPPTYHLSVHTGHIHLVCLDCGTVAELATEHTTDFVEGIIDQTGFRADLTHMAIHGWCQQCQIGSP